MTTPGSRLDAVLSVERKQHFSLKVWGEYHLVCCSNSPTTQGINMNAIESLRLKFKSGNDIKKYVRW